MLDDQNIEQLSSAERAVLEQIIKERKEGGKSITYGTLLNMLYDEIPVDPFEFVDSKKYLNLKDNIYNRIKYLFAEIDKDDVHEAWVACGRGMGKTTVTSILMVRTIYKLLCLKNPQEYYRLVPNSDIAAINLSVGESQARNVCFKAIVNAISRSEWFKDRYEPLVREIRFQKNIIAYSGHSASNAFLGYNFLFAVLDEADWFVNSEKQDNAAELYGVVKGSLATRWKSSDNWKICVISSPASDTGFMMSTIDGYREGATHLDPYKWPIV